MSWNIVYTEQAECDLRDIFEYIAFNLLVLDTAKKQTRRIMDAILSLEEMPMRHSLYDKDPWYTKGLRLLPIDNYLVFYLPIESEKAVVIIRIMYEGRDINHLLDNK